MKRLSQLVLVFSLLLSEASAQITGGGFGSTASIPALLSELLGINIGNPTELIGLLATFGLMWLSAYLIFKIAIGKLDEGLDGRNGFADAFGIARSEDRNILAVLTLLVTLSVIGTGAFYGLIRGWQSMILLAFTFMIIAGLMFVLIGGTGFILGGGGYLLGKSAKSVARGVKEASEEVEKIRGEEDEVEELEESIDREEDDARRKEEGDTDSSTDTGSRGASEVERELEDIANRLERVIQLIEDIENRIEGSISTELENLKNDLQALKELLRALGVQEGHEGFENLRNVVERLEISRDELEELLSLNEASGEAEARFRDIINSAGALPVTEEELDLLEQYLNELERLKNQVSDLEANNRIYSELQDLIEGLEAEIGHAVDEEKDLQELIDHLESSRNRRKIAEEYEYEINQLKELKKELERIRDMDERLKDLEEHIKELESHIGGLDALRNAIDVRKILTEQIIDSSSTGISTAKFVSFDSEAEAEASIRPGLTIFPSGKSNTTLKVDIGMSAGSHTGKKAFEFDKKSRGLIKRFEGDIRNFIKSRDISRKSKVGEELVNVFESINSDINSSKIPDRDRKNILLSEAFDSLRFDSDLVNAVYLGFLIHNFRPIYDHRLVDELNSSKVGAWRPVRDFIDDAFVSLGFYRVGGGVFPCVFVDTESIGVCFCPATGDVFRNIERERIEEVFYTFES
ncbi:hypothetical protein ACK3SF_03495 [Candidatus Nanosalina sp. VS9-1]|uniref:hypothetical protein n=1 Tax=Candidatus Nanosalina sp. VS9-1 TaxID=3388566 RepID=UPI0039DF433B